jgi:hypothetical protein
MLRLLSVVVLISLPMLSAAQSRPDFTGTWKCDVGRSLNCFTDTIVITHTGDTLTMQRAGEKAVVQSFRLNGTETINDPAQEIGVTSRKLAQLKSTSRWEGSTIVTESESIEDSPIVMKSVLSLSADGKELTIESARAGRMGTTKTVYTKTAS